MKNSPTAATQATLINAEGTIFRSQHGLATRSQLLSIGVTDKQIEAAVRRGHWLRYRAGLYQLANWPDGPAQRVLAACLVTGGVASHSSAAWLWGLLRYEPVPPVVSVPHRLHFGEDLRSYRRPPGSGSARSQGPAGPFPGMVVHRSCDLTRCLISTRSGVPTTNPLRALVDMAGDGRPAQLDEAIDAALATGLVTVAGLVAEAGRLKRRGRRGPAALLERLECRGFTGGPPASVLESLTLRLLHKAGVKVVRRETRAEGARYRLDFELEGQVFVEVDGYAYHWSPEHKSHDDARQNALLRLGFSVLVYGWHDIKHEPERVVTDIRAMAGRANMAP